MMPRKGHKKKKKLEWEKYKFDAPEGTWKKKKKKNYSWLHPRVPSGAPLKKKKKKKKITILCRSFEAPYLSDKTNRIKIGWEMKEKKQFMWFGTNFQAPQ